MKNPTEKTQSGAMNEAWMAWVDRANLPTRTAVGADLTPATMVEITVCAAK